VGAGFGCCVGVVLEKEHKDDEKEERRAKISQ